MTYPLYDFGGPADAPLVHLAVANGFPPQTYIPLVRPLLDRYHVVCIPPRALWPGNHDPRRVRSWRDLGKDILAGLRAHNLRDVIAIGHSFGGVASMLVVNAEPSRFRALALLDPTFVELPLRYSIILWFVQRLGHTWERVPLVPGALRRRRDFESVEAAYTYFKSKSLFSDWPDETVRLYAESNTRPAGDGVELAWTPEWEARYYSAMFPWSWREIPKLRGRLPVLTLRGAHSDTLTPSAAERLRRILPDMTYGEIEGGHLFPQSVADAASGAIIHWLDHL